MIKCNICGKEYKNIQPLIKHITSYHNLDKRPYYDKYMKQPNEGICLICNSPTDFYWMDRGYNTYCCRKCQVTAQNNFGKIPKPVLIHASKRNYHVYGAGKLL